MRRNWHVATGALIVVFAVGIAGAVDAPEKAQINVGGVVGLGGLVDAGSGWGGWVEGEFPVHEKLSLSARLVHYRYSYDEEDLDPRNGISDNVNVWIPTPSYEEDGNGTMAGTAFRFYPRGTFRGFFLGFGVAGGTGKNDYKYTGPVGFLDDGTEVPNPEIDKDGESGLVFEGHLELGGTIRTGRVFALSPQFIAGWYTGTKDTGLIVALGLVFNFGI